jgi:hypothetical protein
LTQATAVDGPAANNGHGFAGQAVGLVWNDGAADNGLFLACSNAMVLAPYGRVVVDSSALRGRPGGGRPRSWPAGRQQRPELYAILAARRGDEQSPSQIRFGTVPPET